MIYLRKYSKRFYKTTAWKHKRKDILERDNHECQECKKLGRVTSTSDELHVHHIKHYKDYPELALTDENLITLCAACHNKEHPEKGYSKKQIEIHEERWE